MQPKGIKIDRYMWLGTAFLLASIYFYLGKIILVLGFEPGLPILFFAVGLVSCAHSIFLFISNLKKLKQSGNIVVISARFWIIGILVLHVIAFFIFREPILHYVGFERQGTVGLAKSEKGIGAIVNSTIIISWILYFWFVRRFAKSPKGQIV